MVLKVNGAFQIQYKAIELGSDHIILQGGGGWVFQTGQNIFSLTFRARIFFPIYYEPAFFLSSKVGQNIVFYTIQLWKQLHSYESVTKLLYWGYLSVCLSVCVCVRPQLI